MMCLILLGGVQMKKLQMTQPKSITFGEGCELYLTNCKQRNLREGTLRHYRQSYLQFYKFFNEDMPLEDFTQSLYNDYVLHLRETLLNDVSINSYLRDLITTLRFLMQEDYLKPFQMKSIKVDNTQVETYTDDELKKLLQKPNLKKCSFIEYQSWVMTNFLFATGVRQRSLMNIRIKDIDFDNNILHVNVTKNRKPLIIPLNQTLVSILKEYLKHRQVQHEEDWLFVNVYGQQLLKATCYSMLYTYNKKRGVETTGIHRYRHTFAKAWILNGGNVATLARLLGHSNLSVTQNYVNLLVTDLAKQVDEINLLDKYSSKKRIKL